MTSLLRAELRRATSRRLVRFGTAVALLSIAVAGALTAASSHGSNRFELFGLPSILMGVAPLLVLGGLVVGASLVGAEWHAGTMTTLLTWEPRRVRVLVAKALSAVAVVIVLAIALQVVLSLVLWIVAATRGSTIETGGDWLRRVAGTLLRVAGASSAASLIGLAIAMLGRNTAAALGAGFAYLGILEGLIRGLHPTWQPWLLGDNVAVFVSGHVVHLGVPPGDVLRTVEVAGLIAFAYAAGLLVIAAIGFRLRDVN